MYNIGYANFGIDRKRTDDKGNITELLIHRRESNGNMSNIGWYSRQSIIKSIKEEKQTYMTIRIDQVVNTWSAGAHVHVVSTKNGDYLRTDQNQIAADNLDSLPEG